MILKSFNIWDLQSQHWFKKIYHCYYGEIEEKLVNLRSKYTDNQRVISRLNEERSLLT